MATVFDVAYYLLHIIDQQEDNNDLSNLKLQKLCYYAQGFHLAIHDQPLFDEEIEAWVHGPVIPELYHRFKSFGRNYIDTNEIDHHDYKLTKPQKELIDEVFEVFGQYSAWTLRNMTHEESPWRDYEHRAGVIPQSDMQAYFKTRLQ